MAGKPHVTVLKAGDVKDDRLVEMGISDGLKTEISSGVAEGETVVLYNGGDSKFRGEQRPRGMMGIH